MVSGKEVVLHIQNKLRDYIAIKFIFAKVNVEEGLNVCWRYKRLMVDLITLQKIFITKDVI